MKTFYLPLFLLFNSLLTAQTTLTLQPDAAAGKDAQISSINPALNISTTPEFIAAAWTFQGDFGIYRSLIDFDLSSIPAGATILDAKLSLYYNFLSGSAGQAGSNFAYLKRITDPWEEHTVTWNTQPGTTDEDQVFLSTSQSSAEDYLNIDVAPMIKTMLADQANSFGFMFMLNTEATYRSMKFFSSDGEQGSLRPKLEITYITDSEVCISLQPGSEGKDAAVLSNISNTNIGGTPEFIAASWTFSGDEGHYRSFLEFDLSAIPSDAEITSAYLSLFYNPISGSAGQEGENTTVLQRVTGPWDENTLHWNNQPSTTTSNGVILPQSSIADQDYTNINVKPLVQDMIDNPSMSHGFMMRQLTEDIYRSMKFASSDYEDPSRHPLLEVCYRNTVSSNDLQAESIDVKPNPFHASIIIEIPIGKYLISLTDVNGKTLYSETSENIDGDIEIGSLGHLSAGIYFINVSGTSKNYFSKVVKRN